MEAALATGASAEGGGGGIGTGKEPAAAVIAQSFQIDEVYEFSAPRFFDFLSQESDDQVRKAELWFDTRLSYAQSPFVNAVKGRKSYKEDSINCDLGETEDQKLPATENLNFPAEEQDTEAKDESNENFPACEIQEADLHTGESEIKEMEEKRDEENEDQTAALPVSSPAEDLRNQPGGNSSKEIDAIRDQITTTCSSLSKQSQTETPTIWRKKENLEAENGSKNRTAKKIASLIKNTSSMKPRIQKIGHISSSGPGGDIAQENQAIKRQKLEGGLTRQIHNVKNRTLIHKSKPNLPADGGDLLLLSGVNRLAKKEEIQRRPKLTLTRPKEPELETAHRVRAVRIKSSAELEEEMLSKIPKFKARPINKKILEAPSMPTPQRSIPHPPEFQEFNLKTMERASRNTGPPSSAVSSSMESSSFYDHFKMKRLTQPKIPHLETSLRARPPRVKSSQELELEELEKIPKFKARPLNKKIFEANKGDNNVSNNLRPKITIPQEFHFATSERLGPSPPALVFEAFDKLSLHSEAQTDKRQAPPRLTIPNPFHLHTEERGLEKERDLSLQIQRKEMEQEKARVPKANPYPYTTDYPVFPPKPVPKGCTKPEGFQLESLLRHEEVMQKKMEEMERMEREEAQKRVFKAQPILTKDPFPTVKRERKPLTEVQGFDLHVDHRAEERSDFDKKIQEKETMYKRLREECDAAKKIEEEREVKQMRKSMVPTARPLPNFFNPFLPQKSTKEITKPKSPALKVAMRLIRRRQQIHSHPTSLTQMR